MSLVFSGLLVLLPVELLFFLFVVVVVVVVVRCYAVGDANAATYIRSPRQSLRWLVPRRSWLLADFVRCAINSAAGYARRTRIAEACGYTSGEKTVAT